MPPYLDFQLYQVASDTGLPADIFNGSSGFNRFNYGNDLMLSKTGFTHSDLLYWQIDYAGGSLNVNGTIMRDTYSMSGNVRFWYSIILWKV